MIAPENYVLEEERFIFRAPAAAQGIDFRTGQPLTSVRENLIVARQTVPSDVTLDELAHQRLAELLHALGDMTDAETGTFIFADKAEGRLIAVTVPAMGVVKLRQFHALRLDGAVLTAATITVDAARLSDDAQHTHLTTLAQVGPREG